MEGDTIYKQFFEHFDKIEQLFKGKPGNIGLFYTMNNKYFLLDAIRVLDNKQLFSGAWLKQMKDSLDKDIYQYVEVCWQKIIVGCLSEIQVVTEKDGRLKSSTSTMIKKRLTVKILSFRRNYNDYRILIWDYLNSRN